MPRKKASPRKAAAAPKRGRPKGHGGSAPGTFICPECGFKARHAMGLGRHRSARHGAKSARSQRAGTQKSTAGRGATAAAPAGWLTRRQAAELGGVHYNTVRLWERAKLFKTQQRDRDVLIEEAGFRATLERKKNQTRGRPVGAKTGTSRGRPRTQAAASASAPPATSSAPAAASFEVTELLARLDALADGLEALARQVRPRKRRGRPPKR